MSRQARQAHQVRRSKGSPGPKRWWLLGGLIVLGVVAYANTFDVPFVFDDTATIARNTGVRFGEFNWNPLSGRTLLYITFTLNYLWGEFNVWSYHFVNLVLHLINGFLIFLIAEHIFHKVAPNVRNGTYAFIASAFFIIHPVQTESVTYISSRSELLSTLFYLGAFLVFVKWPEKKIGLLCSMVILVLFFLGLASKETVISLPAALFLYDFIFLSNGSFRPMLRRWLFYSPFIAGGIVASYYLATITLRAAIGSGVGRNLSSWHYFLTQLRVIVRYVYLVFFPVGLNLIYDFPPSQSLLEWKVIASLLILLALVVWGWTIRKRQPVVSFSILWFFITLAPTSSFVPIADVIFEHRLYLPLAGVCLALPEFLESLSIRLRRWFGFPLAAGGYATLILGLMTVGTIVRNNTWRSEISLFEDVASKSPHDLRAQMGVALAYANKGDLERAIAATKRGLDQVEGDKTELLDTLGNFYLRVERYDEAASSFRETTLLYTDPKEIAVAYNNVGVAYMRKWKDFQPRRNEMTESDFKERAKLILEPAQVAFLKSYEMNPDVTTAMDSYINASFALGTAGSLEATSLMELEKNETFSGLYTLGKIAFLREDWARADEFFTRAERLKSNDLLFLFNHAYVLEKLNQLDRGIQKYIQAIRIDPNFVAGHYNLALLYKRAQKIRKQSSIS